MQIKYSDSIKDSIPEGLIQEISLLAFSLIPRFKIQYFHLNSSKKIILK